jgi:hypothetical protein
MDIVSPVTASAVAAAPPVVNWSNRKRLMAELQAAGSNYKVAELLSWAFHTDKPWEILNRYGHKDVVAVAVYTLGQKQVESPGAWMLATLRLLRSEPKRVIRRLRHFAVLFRRHLSEWFMKWLARVSHYALCLNKEEGHSEKRPGPPGGGFSGGLRALASLLGGKRGDSARARGDPYIKAGPDPGRRRGGIPITDGRDWARLATN